MFRSRNDRISELISLYQQLELSNIHSLIENPFSITKDVEEIRKFLKTEIESFSIRMTEACFNITKQIDLPFADKVIEYNPKFYGEVLVNCVVKYYDKVGFDFLFNFISQIKNYTPAIDGIEALFQRIIIDGENHRTEACELTKKLEEISSTEEIFTLTSDQMLRVESMIERLKPHARPIIKKMFLHEDMEMKKGEANGVSHPIFSRTGNWAEHSMIMGVLSNQFDETKGKFRKAIKK